MKFELKRPCKDCPFLRGKNYLSPTRARSIAKDVLENDKTFACHKTLNYDGGDDGPVDTAHAQHCAGALIMCERNDKPNQMMRIAERLGLYDHTRLDMKSDVYVTVKEMEKGHGGI